MNRDRKITFIIKIFGIGFYIAIIYNILIHLFFKVTYPFNSFFISSNDIFADFFWPYAIAFDPYSISRPDFQNLPFLYFLMRFFRLFRNEKVALLVYLSSFLTFFILELKNNIFQIKRSRLFFYIVVLSAFSYPLLFSLQRANLELLVFIFIVLFLQTYKNNQKMSILLLILAIALKPFPVVFLALFIWDKRYKDIVIVIGTVLILELLSFIILPGGLEVNIHNFLNNLSKYSQFYTVGNSGLMFGNSLWGAIKYVMAYFIPISQLDLSTFTKPYFYCMATLFSIFVFYICKHPIRFEYKILLLICLMDLLPFVSGDYKLLYFYIPLLMFINNGLPERFDWLYALLLGLLFVPKNYLFLYELPNVTVSVLINPVIMITLCILVLYRVRKDFKVNNLLDNLPLV